MRLMRTVLASGLFLSFVPVLSALSLGNDWLKGALDDYWDNPRVVSLGWSASGKWAALIPQDSGYRGGQGLNLCVFDTVEDNILFEAELWDDENLPKQALAAALVRAKAAERFLSTLSRLEIQPSPVGGKMAPFPLVFGANTFTARAEVEVLENLSEFGSQTLGYRIVVEDSSARKKVITSGQISGAYQVTVAGFFAHPRDPRMVVVWESEEPAFEGERQTKRHFSGCKLNSGF